MMTPISELLVHPKQDACNEFSISYVVRCAGYSPLSLINDATETPLGIGRRLSVIRGYA